MNVQNLKRPEKDISKNLARAIELVKAKDLLSIKKEFKSEPLDVVGSLLRSCFIAPAGKKLVICDLSSIEPRVGGWLAKDEEFLRPFREGLDCYIDFGTGLYNQSYEELWHEYKVLKQGEKRQICKPGFLGCLYKLGAGEKKIDEETGDVVYTGLMGYARAMGIDISQEMATKSVDHFRTKYKNGICRCWYDLENAAIRCVRTGSNQTVGYLKFTMTAGVLRMILPSGRAIHYFQPRIVKRDWFGKEKDALQYLGVDQKKHVFTTIFTSGGHLFENAVQAASRDVLANGIRLAEEANMFITMHTHDELVCEVGDNDNFCVDKLRQCMIELPKWADKNLLIDAAGFDSKIYRKE